MLPLPRKTKAAVRVMRPPKPTSKSSLVAEAVRPLRHDVVLLLQVGGVVDDDAEADREGEEDLAGGGEPGLRVRQRLEVRIPHVAEAVDDVLVGSAASGVPRVRTRASTKRAQTAIAGIAQLTNFSIPFERPRKTSQMLMAKVKTQKTRSRSRPPVNTPFSSRPVKVL
jgi:hypothetical protein